MHTHMYLMSAPLPQHSLLVLFCLDSKCVNMHARSRTSPCLVRPSGSLLPLLPIMFHTSTHTHAFSRRNTHNSKQLQPVPQGRVNLLCCPAGQGTLPQCAASGGQHLQPPHPPTPQAQQQSNSPPNPPPSKPHSLCAQQRKGPHFVGGLCALLLTEDAYACGLVHQVNSRLNLVHILTSCTLRPACRVSEKEGGGRQGHSSSAAGGQLCRMQECVRRDMQHNSPLTPPPPPSASICPLLPAPRPKPLCLTPHLGVMRQAGANVTGRPPDRQAEYTTRSMHPGSAPPTHAHPCRPRLNKTHSHPPPPKKTASTPPPLPCPHPTPKTHPHTDLANLTSMSRMSSCTSTSSTSGMMATVAVEVCTRPAASVAGTRCTR